MTSTTTASRSRHTSPVDSLFEASNTPETSFFVSCILAGRYVAAADGIITNAEMTILSDTIKSTLKLNDHELITSLLDDAVAPEYSSDRDLDRLVECSGELGQIVLPHVFAFACRVAGTNPDTVDELPRLAELATIFGIKTSHKDIFLATFCDIYGGLSSSYDELENLIQALHPQNLPDHFGGLVRAIALEHARLINVQQNPSAHDSSARKDENATANAPQRHSSLAATLLDSPARNKILEISSNLNTLPPAIYGSQLRDTVQKIQKTSSDENFRISVTGSFSSGKSTLLNALCGTDGIFPTSTIPCTGAVSILRYGPQVGYWKRSADGNQAETKIDEAEFRRLVELPDDIERAAHLETSNLDALIVEYPLAVCEGGVEIVDSPGLNENPRRTLITERFLKRSDAVVYIMSVRQLASEQDRQQIEQLRDQIGTSHLFFVVNGFDDVAGNPKEEKKVKNRARSYFETIYSDNFEQLYEERVHFLSALKTIQAFEQDEENSRFVADFKRFESELGQYLSIAKGKERWRRKTDELVRVVAKAFSNADTLASSLEDQSDFEQRRAQKKQSLQDIERSKQGVIRASENAKYTINTTGEKALDNLDESFDLLAQQMPEILYQCAEQWESDGNPMWGKKQIQQDFSEQLQADIRAIITQWSETEAQRIIGHHLTQMIARLNQDFEQIQQQMDQMRALTDASFEPAEDTEEDGAFMTFVRAAGGFAAGGPLGALVGATMDWEDVAINFAANAAMGFTLAALGLGSMGVLLPAVALVGAAQALWSAGSAKDKIRAQTYEAGVQNIPTILDSVWEQMVDKIIDTFETLGNQISDLVEQRLDEIENLAREQLRQLEEISGDEALQKEQARTQRQWATRIHEWGLELEPFSSVQFQSALHETGHSDKKTSDLGSSNDRWFDEGEHEVAQSNKRAMLLAAALIVALICIGAWFVFAS